MTTSVHLARIAETAARGAGAIALEGFRSRDLVIDEKADFHDPVTLFDKRSEEHVREVIEREVPGSRIVGEEGGETGDGDVTWYIDPIDGTANFASGIALWTVSIAAAVDGEVVAGVVYDPVADRMFLADERGAFLDGDPLRAEGATTPERATIVPGFVSHRDLRTSRAEALDAFGQLLETFAHVRTFGSSAISLCHVAAGWADATFSFGTSPWDVAAAAFILRQAGGVYRTFAAGEERPARSDHLGAHYFGAVRGADFPLIERIMREHSARRDAARA
ncbi:inositol monophosphatase family protein [Microbacterium karelineae]|uniref:inositol monophosphatase family protein n=1 Tax=Microbacterium karelineae TaxID=2654283 RepID=UPI0012EADF93|nr:inositol monophosphatase family protein [Microbacterium karelineae]